MVPIVDEHGEAQLIMMPKSGIEIAQKWFEDQVGQENIEKAKQTGSNVVNEVKGFADKAS